MVGQRIGHFEIEQELGRGGMGVVWRARDLELDRPVALKALSPEAAEDSRLRREARAAARIDHPNVAAVHEIFRHEGRAYLAMQLVEGESLRERLRRGPVPAEEAASLGRGIAAGLAEAHRRGIVHRDLKPENVMIAADGTPKLTDFGLALAADPSATRSRSRGIAGTPAYIAPEILRGDTPGPASDVFSTGVLLYELWSGRNPFARPAVPATLHALLEEEAPPLTAVRADVPAPLAALVGRMLAKDPASRPADGGEVARALGGGAPARAPRRPGAPAAIAGVVAIAAAAALVVATLRDPPPRSPTPPPAPARRLAGIVTGPGGPVARAVVTVDGHSFFERTTSDGRFEGRVDAPAGESLVLRVTHEDYITHTSRVPADAASDTVRLRLEPAVRAR